MPRFCRRCGARNADDARFCAACGAPLDRPAAALAPSDQAAPPSAAAGRGAAQGSSRAAWWVLAALTVVLVIAAAAAWEVFGRVAGPSDAQARAAADAWLRQHQPQLLQDACARNVNYAANPVFVNAFDRGTRQWLDALVTIGIYSAPREVRNGFLTQLEYGHGPQAGTYLRDGALCAASGLAIVQVQVLPPGSGTAGERLPDGVKLPDDWALVALTLKWTGLAPWAGREPFSSQFPRLSTALHHTVVLHKVGQGWVLPSEAEELGMRAQLGALVAGGEAAQAARQIGQRLGEAAQALGGPTAASTARAAPPGGGWLDRLRGLFDFADPVRRLPQRFYGDVQDGRFDDAYALLGPQLQFLGPTMMKPALAMVRSRIQAKGGLRDMTVNGVTDQGESRLVRFSVRYGNGTTEDGSMLVGKVDGRWRILSSSELR